MKIEFRDKRLAIIRTERAHKLKLPVAVIKAAREKLLLIEAAPDERTLRNWRSLNFKKREGDKEGRRTIRVNDQYRILLVLDETTTPPTVVILDIGDTH
jgi:proteic killer suppression protein